MAPSRTQKGNKTRKASTTSTKAKVAKNVPKSRSKPKPKPKHAAELLAESANKKSSGTLQEFLNKFLGTPLVNQEGESALVWKVYSGPELKGTPQKDGVWSLFETNMRDIYIEAKDPYLKWGPAKKKKELFDEKSRYILLESEDQSELAAFCMFRFEVEENDSGVVEFLMYIYEVQVSKEFQGLGVCRRIFDALERLSSEYQVQLMMLTAFRCNPRAIAAYRHLGYKEHVDTSDTALVLFKTIQ
ncbi:hypothetical protein FRC06_000762 [Ceratobasidium sp. 370]|nr:hypothetical protein FRC06_000762 [Ceratobasidium sp. 370]